MKKLNIAKTLGLIGIYGFIFGAMSCIVTGFDANWAGVVMGLSVPFVFLYPIAVTEIDKQKVHQKEENTKEEPPYEDKMPSPDPTLNNK